MTTNTTDDLHAVLDAVIGRTAETVAHFLGLPAVDDPSNKLRSLALVREATNRAIAAATPDAERQGYTRDEISALLEHPHDF